jgi:3-oxoacyl-[acyl-carrier protein] reductase
MKLNLKEKVAVVTGSSRGIGYEIAHKFASHQAEVYINGRNFEVLKNATDVLSYKFGSSIHSFQGDLTQSNNIRSLVKYIISNSGRLDFLIANIGFGALPLGWDLDDETWNKCMEMNFFSAVRITREILPIMINQKYGVIIFIASIAGCERVKAPAAYAAAKAALLQYMKYLSALVAPEGIRVNAVSPGNIFFEGGRWEEIYQEKPDIVNDYLSTEVPMNRFGRPQEIADVVAYLVSDNAAFINGANFVVDGGQMRSV